MESLNQLLDTCTLPEKTQLVEFAKIKNLANSKKLMLIKLFVDEPGLSDSEYSYKIYRKSECAAYFQLKKRVKDELEALFLILKPSCLKKETQFHIECSELLLKSELILARGIRAEGVKLLFRGLKMAIKNNFHDLVLTIYSIAMRFGLYEVLNKNDLPELELAIKSHLRLLNKKNYKGTEELQQGKNPHLSIMISQLNSSNTSWSILDKIRTSIQQKKYENALTLVEKAEAMCDQDTESSMKDELLLAKMSIHLAKREFDSLLTACTDSRGILSDINSTEHSLFHWYALFHLNKVEEAQKVLQNYLMQMDPDQVSRWTLWSAFIYFKKEEWIIALKQIHACQKDLKSNSDYYLGSKMLELMILFEQNDQDWLEYKIENFRKLIARRKEKVNNRIQQAFWLLAQMHKLLNKPAMKELEKTQFLIDLDRERNGLIWYPDSFELIRYDAWIFKVLEKDHL